MPAERHGMKYLTSTSQKRQDIKIKEHLRNCHDRHDNKM